MVHNVRVTVKEVSIASMEHMDPFQAPLVLINGKVGILLCIKVPHMLTECHNCGLSRVRNN